MKKIFTLFSVFFTLCSATSHAENVEISVYDVTNGSDMKGFTSEVTVDDNGIYTIKDLMGTGVPVQFKIASTENTYGYYDITFEGNLYTQNVGYPYLLDDAGNFVTTTVYGQDGSENYLFYTYFYEDSYYTSAEKRDEDGKNMYDCYMYMSGFDAENAAAPYYELSFSIAAPSMAGIGSAIADSDDANTPVEYFNLQGIRVENPENGMYIRRQGSKT